MAEAWQPPSDEKIHVWARQHVTLGPAYSIQGEFHIERSRHLIGPLDAIWDESVRSVAFEKAVKIGGTMVADIAQLYLIENRPGPMMLVMQTDKEAENQSVTKTLPNIRACKALAKKLSDNRHDITISRILFKSGLPFYINGPSLSKLQAKDVRYLWGDECWEWTEDTIKQAEGRIAAYKRIGTDKTVLISQGSEIRIENGIEIPHFFDARMRRATDKWWHVPCPHCLVRFNPRLEYLDDQGVRVAGLLYDGNGNQVRYVCPNCQQAIIDSPRLKAAWNDGGDYVQMNPAPARGEESFHCGAIPISPWEPLAREHADAMQSMRNGSITAFKAFIQKQMAESWKDKIGAEPVQLEATGFGENSEWPDEKYRLLTFDVQKDHQWFIARAWSADGRSRLLKEGRCATLEDVREIQLKLAVKDGGVFGDEAYGRRMAEVRRAAYRYGWKTMRGASSETKRFWHVTGKDQNGQPIKVEKFWRLVKADVFEGSKTHELKDYLATLSPASQARYLRGDRTVTVIEWCGNPYRDLMRTLIEGRGAEWLAYDGVSHTYRAHLAGQRKETVTNKKTGMSEEIWRVIADDHELDCETEQLPVVDMLGILKI